jgi:uncharacterized protein (DUF924 family)
MAAASVEDATFPSNVNSIRLRASISSGCHPLDRSGAPQRSLNTVRTGSSLQCSPSAFAADTRALSIAREAIARGLDIGLIKDERMFLYLPFEHAEDAEAQARCVTLMATLHDPELMKWAEAHRRIIDRFGRFPHRNRMLGRTSTPEEAQFLTQPNSSF